MKKPETLRRKLITIASILGLLIWSICMILTYLYFESTNCQSVSLSTNDIKALEVDTKSPSVKSIVYAKTLPFFSSKGLSETTDFFNQLLEPYNQETGRFSKTSKMIKETSITPYQKVWNIESVKISDETQKLCPSLMEDEKAWKITLVRRLTSLRPVDINGFSHIDQIFEPCIQERKNLGKNTISKNQLKMVLRLTPRRLRRLSAGVTQLRSRGLQLSHPVNTGMEVRYDNSIQYSTFDFCKAFLSFGKISHCQRLINIFNQYTVYNSTISIPKRLTVLSICWHLCHSPQLRERVPDSRRILPKLLIVLHRSLLNLRVCRLRF